MPRKLNDNEFEYGMANSYVDPDGRFYLEDYYECQFGDNYKVESVEEEYKDDKDIVHLVSIRHFGYRSGGKCCEKLLLHGT